MLKIIALVIAGIIALIIALAAALLFVPVRYKLTAANDGDSGESSVAFKASWLLGFFRVRYDGGRFHVTAFWFKKLNGNKSGESRKKKQNKKPSNASDTPKTNKTTDEIKEKEEKTQKKTKSETKKKKRDIKEIINTLKSVSAYPDKELLWNYTWTLAVRIVKALKPKKLSVFLDVGFDNPANTGYLLAILGIIQGIWSLDLDVRGNFDEKTLKYRVVAADALMLWSLTWPLVAYCFKPPVWKLIKKYVLKKGDKDEPVA